MAAPVAGYGEEGERRNSVVEWRLTSELQRDEPRRICSQIFELMSSRLDPSGISCFQAHHGKHQQIHILITIGDVDELQVGDGHQQHVIPR